ncbi:gliding motility-associated-like protein [Balneicella halophila]|uniref:Gliding motility-associated-like protein n=1 Tax=Balneicella halophila TaxID=1537566 RepID=A0A7L4UNL5_BALHA|nr:gliding motility-associated C-terminal domain-containing protein [Balneicella halophila]PVX50688.1 gliding motility-associated-like protein [Balneicella halophila]
MLGTDPNNKDTDHDNIVDLEEVSNILNPIDTDSDGVIDALESNILDKDDDGLVDQIDVDDNDPCVPDISSKCKIEFTQIVNPNGDNINDILKLEFLKNYPSNKVSIFSKSGKVVFSEENYGYNKKYFKGYGKSSFLNKKLPAGVYFYIIEFHDKNGKLIEKSGYFYLIY